jgi:GT2 family glycosyltransferase
MKISIIVPTYNRNEMLRSTLKNILSFQDQYHELIVVDQTKEHDTETTLFLDTLKNEEKIILLCLDYPNLPNARNEGIKAAAGDIVLFLDDDVEIHRDFIPAHLAVYDDPEIGGTTGPVTVVNPGKNDNIVFKNSLPAKRLMKAIVFFFIRKKASSVSRFGVISDFSGTKRLYADTGIGCNLAFRKEIFAACGFFDVNYMGNAIREDTDMCLRVRKSGYKIVYEPRAKLIHYMENSGGTRNAHPEEYWKAFFQNQCYFYVKNFSSAELLIRFVLALDLRRCKKSGVDAEKIFSRSYHRAKTLAAKQAAEKQPS